LVSTQKWPAALGPNYAVPAGQQDVALKVATTVGSARAMVAMGGIYRDIECLGSARGKSPIFSPVRRQKPVTAKIGPSVTSNHISPRMGFLTSEIGACGTHLQTSTYEIKRPFSCWPSV
jgi:hypothetical protein